MILALKAAQPAVPQTVTVVNHELPRMKDGEDIDTFVAMFKAALRANKVPETLWKAKLHSHLNMKIKLKVQMTIQDSDSTYEESKRSCSGVATCHSAQQLKHC